MIIDRVNKRISSFVNLNDDGSKTYISVGEVYDGIGNYKFTEVMMNGVIKAMRNSTLEALEASVPAEIAEEIIDYLRK